MKSWSGVVAATIVAWFIVYSVAGQISYALQRGTNLTEIIDSYSEANGVRAGESYADRGFTFNYGLPDVGYGNSFEGTGGKHDVHLCPTLPCIYLHYPPGPDLVIGAMTKMCGKGNLSCLRTAPILAGFLAFVFLAWAMARTIGIERCAFVFATFYFVPMTTNGMHNLHYHSYVVSVLYVYAGILLMAFLRPATSERLVTAGVFLVGFAYGFMSFDYAFHMACLPVPFWLMSGDLKKNLRKLVFLTGVVCTGFAIASVLHLVQVRMFLGSWHAVIEDFGARAATRFNGNLEASNPVQPVLRLLWIYWTRLLMEPNFVAGSFLGPCAATATILMARSPVTISRQWNLEWAPRAGYKWAFLAAFVIPDMWLLFMRQHASVHGHFLPRNFIVTFVVGAMLLALSVRKRAAEPSRIEEAAIAA